MLPSISSLRRGSARIGAGKDVRFIRDEQLRRRTGKLAQDRLASDYDQILGVGDYAGGSDDVRAS